MPARIVDAEPTRRGDIALLDVDGTDFPTATLAPGADPTPGTPVTAVGYSGERDRATDPGRAPSWQDGTVPRCGPAAASRSSRSARGGPPA